MCEQGISLPLLAARVSRSALSCSRPAAPGLPLRPIYKCLDKNLGLLYTDEPCKDGEQLNIRAGDADPAAVARLERARDALDQSAAQRMADDRRDAALVERAALMAYAPAEERGANDYGPANVSDYGFVSHPFMHHHPKQRRQPKLHHVGHFAPHPPFIVPRR
jgi:hypothetical protein